MLPARRRALWLEPARLEAALDARWAVANRVGDGERHLSDELRTRLRHGASPARWHRRGDERGERHGAGYLDIDDAGRRRDARPSDRAGEIHARRHSAPEGAGTRRLDDHGE